MQHKTNDKLKHRIMHTFIKRSNSAKHYATKKPCYRKDDCAMRPIYKLFTQFCSRLRPLYFAWILILNEFKLWKFCLLLQEWRFGRSRSSEVIDFGANWKRVCDFLLVHNSNLGPILHHFGDMTAIM